MIGSGKFFLPERESRFEERYQNRAVERERSAAAGRGHTDLIADGGGIEQSEARLGGTGPKGGPDVRRVGAASRSGADGRSAFAPGTKQASVSLGRWSKDPV